jgi:hypothetical protein
MKMEKNNNKFVPATNEKNNNLMILPSPFSQNF